MGVKIPLKRPLKYTGALWLVIPLQMWII